MKELSIFIDEFGDFGEYDFHSPYYIVSLSLSLVENRFLESTRQLNKNYLKQVHNYQCNKYLN